MCIEDIRLARGTTVRKISVAVQNANTVVVPGHASRIRLICPVPATNAIWLMPYDSAVNSRGIQLFATMTNLVIDIEKYGQLVTANWNAISPAGAQTVDFWEVLLTER